MTTIEIDTPDGPIDALLSIPPGNGPWPGVVVIHDAFGYGRDKANKLMLDVHHKGKAIVSSGSKDKVEADVAKLHAAGLWATMQRSG